MPAIDWINLKFKQGIQAASGIWYNNLQRLGTGGNAVTYLMMADGGPFRGVCFAVKVFQRVSKPERRASFLEEIKFLQGCDHPGIMRVYDEGVYREDYPFVVAEYLQRTMAAVMRAGASTLSEKLSFVLQLLSTLAWLDEKAVVHRDIKPQNIFVKGRSCVLGDFGLMKRLARQEDADERKASIKESVPPGMPFFYRTPDLVSYARGESDITTRSDIFQLGLVAAQLFSGLNPQLPAEHGDFLSDVQLRQIAPIPGGFGIMIRNLIESMLEKNATKRGPAARLLDAWRGLFLDVAKQQEALEGRVFL